MFHLFHPFHIGVFIEEVGGKTWNGWKFVIRSIRSTTAGTLILAATAGRAVSLALVFGMA